MTYLSQRMDAITPDSLSCLELDRGCHSVSSPHPEVIHPALQGLDTYK